MYYINRNQENEYLFTEEETRIAFTQEKQANKE